MSNNDWDMNGMDILREIRDLLQELVDRTPTQAQRYYEATVPTPHEHQWRLIWSDLGGSHYRCPCGMEKTR